MENRTVDNALSNLEERVQVAGRRKCATGKLHKFDWKINMERKLYFRNRCS